MNTEIDDLKASVIELLKAGQPVFFGCDVGQFSDREAGIMDTSLHKASIENAFNITIGMTKAERLQTNESQMTHAMVITGAHVDPSTGRAARYRVENSWGPEPGDKGYFVMTDTWFDEFVYQVVVPKKLAPEELVDVFEAGEKIVLPPWDPMVSHVVYPSFLTGLTLPSPGSSGLNIDMVTLFLLMASLVVADVTFYLHDRGLPR